MSVCARVSLVRESKYHVCIVVALFLACVPHRTCMLHIHAYKHITLTQLETIFVITRSKQRYDGTLLCHKNLLEKEAQKSQIHYILTA